MAIRYYLINLEGGPGNRLQTMAAQYGQNGTNRRTSTEIFHARTSPDGLLAFAQAETTDTEHTQLLGLGYVTHIGDFVTTPNGGVADQATRDWMAANAWAQ